MVIFVCVNRMAVELLTIRDSSGNPWLVVMLPQCA